MVRAAWPRLAGRMAVGGTAVLALGGFVLSFTALRDLAVRVGMPEGLAWIWPLLIDGLIVEATLAVVRLSQLRRRAVWYAWTLLVGGAVTSVGSNGAHAVVTGHGAAGAAAAAVAPVVLLAMTHLTVLLLERPDDDVGTGHSGAADGEVAAPLAPRQEEAGSRALPAGPAPDATGQALPSGTSEGRRQEAAAARESVDPRGLEEWVAAQEEAGVVVTGVMVAERLGCSASTGRRRLAAIRRSRSETPHLRLAADSDSTQERRRA